MLVQKIVLKSISILFFFQFRKIQTILTWLSIKHYYNATFQILALSFQNISTHYIHQDLFESSFNSILVCIHSVHFPAFLIKKHTQQDQLLVSEQQLDQLSSKFNHVLNALSSIKMQYIIAQTGKPQLSKSRYSVQLETQQLMKHFPFCKY